MNQDEDNPLPTSPPSHNQTEGGDTPLESSSNPSTSTMESPASSRQMLPSESESTLAQPTSAPSNTLQQSGNQMPAVQEFQHQSPFTISVIPFILRLEDQITWLLHTRSDTPLRRGMSIPLQVTTRRQPSLEFRDPLVVTLALLSSLIRLEYMYPTARISARIQLTPIGTRAPFRPWLETLPRFRIGPNARLFVHVQIQVPHAGQSNQRPPLMTLATTNRIRSGIQIVLNTSNIRVFQREVTPMTTRMYLMAVTMALPEIEPQYSPDTISIRVRGDLSRARTPQIQPGRLLRVRVRMSAPVRLRGTRSSSQPPSPVRILDPLVNADNL